MLMLRRLTVIFALLVCPLWLSGMTVKQYLDSRIDPTSHAIDTVYLKGVWQGFLFANAMLMHDHKPLIFCLSLTLPSALSTYDENIIDSQIKT